MQDALNFPLLGNTIFSYLTSLAILITGLMVAYIFKKHVVSRLKKYAESTTTPLDDLLVSTFEKALLPILYFGALYLSLHTLKLSEVFGRYLQIAAMVLITVLIVRALTAAINYALHSHLSNVSDSSSAQKQLKGMSGLINIIIWLLALVFLLDNLGVKISAVVAGLGIGGIAVALAAQAVLGDLFSYFVIFFDKPFEIGDFIMVDDKLGVVEHVGIKTTRLRSLGGELLVFSNTDLTNSRLHNYQKMEQRRMLFSLGVTYQTPASKLKIIPQIVKDIIEAQEGTTFNRGHFVSYGDFSLNFDFAYYVTSTDYNTYMDRHQSVNLGIYEAFEQQKIDFAYPTRTVFLNKES